jgi:hypothetical protein
MDSSLSDLARVMRTESSVAALVSALIDFPVDPDPFLEEHPGFWRDLLARVDDLVAGGLEGGDREQALDFHRTLHRLFRLGTVNHRNLRELSWHLAGLRVRMARQWIAIEVGRAAYRHVGELDPDDVEPWFRSLVGENAAVDHPLYAFLEHEADVDQFRYFMYQESSVDADFVDLLALTQLGFADSAKAELAHNFWDEMGEGDAAWEHSRMFDQSLKSLGVAGVTDNGLSLESLVCGNLLWATSFYRCYHRLSLGALGALETASPTRFQRLANSSKRLSLPDVIWNYYDLHVHADTSHSTGWIRNAVVPMVAADQDAAIEIAVGVELRLSTSSRYCDAVYATLTGGGPLGAAGRPQVVSGDGVAVLTSVGSGKVGAPLS